MSEPAPVFALGTFVFPVTAHGLRWSDEFAWSPVAQSTEFSLTGALLVQEATRQAGRPLTLVGGLTWAWLARADLLTLQTLLDTPTAGLTLTLHDGRQFTVIPRRDGDGPLSASPVPVIRDSGPADPSDATHYALNEIRLLILEELA